ncbi:MAG: M48 family metalloprotease [Planctomycetes bacterium]|nr:M48 family metalloprotease [Planctomycetota bacterium]
MWSWLLIPILMGLPPLSTRLFFRLLVRGPTGDFESDARARTRWQGMTGKALQFSFGSLLALFLLELEWKSIIPWPVLAMVLLLVQALMAYLTFWVIARQDMKLRGLEGTAWKNAFSSLYVNWLVHGNTTLGFLFIPLGLADFSPAAGWRVNWQIGAAYFLAQAVYLLFMHRLLNLVFRLEVPPGDKLARALSTHAGAYRSAARFKTFGSKLLNAFAFPLHKKILFSECLVEEMSELELEAILCHELGHFQSRLETLVRTASACLFPLIPAIAFPWLLGMSSQPDSHPLLLALGLIAALVTLRRFFFMKISRRREIVADLFAIEHCLDPDSYASALIKLHRLNWIPSEFHPRGKETGPYPSLRKRLELIRDKDLVKSEPRLM